MKRNFARAALLLLSVVFMFGCAATSGTDTIKNITDESLSKVLTKGKTTQEDVLAEFGEPTSKMMYPYGQKQEKGTMWTYTYMESGRDGKQFIPLVGGFLSKNKSATRTLNVMFDKNKKVIDYDYSVSNNSSGSKM